MTKKRGKSYVPAVKDMGLSGIHERDLAKEVGRLEETGSKNIVVSDDDGEYDEPGPWFCVDYRR